MAGLPASSSLRPTIPASGGPAGSKMHPVNRAMRLKEKSKHGKKPKEELPVNGVRLKKLKEQFEEQETAYELQAYKDGLVDYKQGQHN